MPGIKGPRRVHQYRKEFKVTAARRGHRPEIQVKDVATEPNIHPFMLSRWRKEYREDKLQGNVKKSIAPGAAAGL
ncbi:transposase [endosymbiont of unidentified scaly snail isolate Monju]|uniref:transposase n=1 Tax=endosymbiont of unidentified scaly snail isolate Monju TaxID=1248727 RepID=UPI0005D605F6